MSSPPPKNEKNGSSPNGALDRRTTCRAEMFTTTGTVRSATRLKSGSVPGAAAVAGAAGMHPGGRGAGDWAAMSTVSRRWPVTIRPAVKAEASRIAVTASRRGAIGVESVVR